MAKSPKNKKKPKGKCELVQVQKCLPKAGHPIGVLKMKRYNIQEVIIISPVLGADAKKEFHCLPDFECMVGKMCGCISISGGGKLMNNAPDCQIPNDDLFVPVSSKQNYNHGMHQQESR